MLAISTPITTNVILAILSDFAMRIEREELLNVVWCLARGISQSSKQKM